MTDKQAQPAKPVTQNATTRYLTKESLQKLLEKLFPGQTDFKIRVRGIPLERRVPFLLSCMLTPEWLQMKEDQWSFTAPTEVKEVSLPRPSLHTYIRHHSIFYG